MQRDTVTTIGNQQDIGTVQIKRKIRPDFGDAKINERSVDIAFFATGPVRYHNALQQSVIGVESDHTALMN